MSPEIEGEIFSGAFLFHNKTEFRNFLWKTNKHEIKFIDLSWMSLPTINGGSCRSAGFLKVGVARGVCDPA